MIHKNNCFNVRINDILRTETQKIAELLQMSLTDYIREAIKEKNQREKQKTPNS